MNFDLKYISELLQALVMATLPVIAGFAANYLKKQTNVLVMSLDVEKQKALKALANGAVIAAEQIYREGNGAQKKEYAISVIQASADASGLTFDVAVIEAAIERAVFDNFPNFPSFTLDSE